MTQVCMEVRLFLFNDKHRIAHCDACLPLAQALALEERPMHDPEGLPVLVVCSWNLPRPE